MATPSQVDRALDDIARILSDQRAVMVKVKSNASGASGALDAIPTDFADVITTINGYGINDAFEAAAKARFAKFTAEFLALKGDADAVAALNLDD